MKKLRFWLRHEIDADLYACAYATCLVWLAAIFRLWAGADGVGFWPITEMIVLGWAIAWGQKLLYWRETASRRWDAARGVLWWSAPAAVIWAAQAVWGWFTGCPAWMGHAFSAVMAAALLSWWGCIRLICRDESQEWNSLLTQFKARKEPPEKKAHREETQ